MSNDAGAGRIPGAGTAADWRALGLELRAQGQLSEAVQCMQRALGIDAEDADTWNELAHLMRWLGKPADALAATDRAIQLSPRHAAAWFNRGAALVQQGQIDRGIEAYQQALQWRPAFAEAWSNLGLALGAAKRPDEAITAFRRAIEINPALVPVWNNLGGALLERGQPAEALATYKRAVELDARYAQGWSNLADAHGALGQFTQAIDCSQRALSLDPMLAAAWHNRGIAQGAIGALAQAVESFRHAVEIDPQASSSWNALGKVLLRSGALGEAVQAHRRATQSASGDATGWRNLGQALWLANQHAEAIVVMRKAVELQPSHAGIRADLIYQLLALCEWQDLDQQLSALGTTIDAMPAGEEESPHANVMRCADEACNLALARRWADRLGSLFTERLVAPRPMSPEKPITIGYLSSDLHDHATAYLLRGVFRWHDHQRFRINVYSHGIEDGSAIRAEIRTASDVFRDIRALDHHAAAAQIASDGVDILVDLKGWTQGVRYEICALRPAPVQMTYLGFPGSCGASFIDYALVDKIVVPPGSVQHYSEQLINMPHCYQSNDDEQPIAEIGYCRADFGLPVDGVVLCSFNGNQKIDPLVFSVWMRILSGVPGAVLWLLTGNAIATANLLAQAKQYGVAPERIVFAKSLPRPLHLRRLQMADLALDTMICNGHTTTSDALWAGLPVLTLRGCHFASRVSASCLAAIDMPELITETLQDYENLALRLATDTVLLAATRRKLQRNRRTTPLFDSRRFTRNLEKAYLGAWRLHQAAHAPESFSVEDMEPLYRR